MHHGVEFRNITKRYGLSASAPLVVKGVSFEVPRGTLTTILGPSGCGKTTVLRMIAGLEMPTGGQIIMDGKDVTTLGPADRNVSMMFQSYALFPHMNVLENVMYGLKMSGVARDEARRRGSEALKNVGLVGYDDRLPSELSGGQQQRVALARALITQPRVLLLDEPLSALDPFLRIQMRAELRRWQKELGLTFIHVTHSQEEAMALADTMVVMNHGVIEQVGSPHEVYNRPASEFVARFMGGHNVIDTPEGKVGVRTDHLQIAAADAELPGGAQRMQAVVTDVEYQGTYVLLGLQKRGVALSANAMPEDIRTARAEGFDDYWTKPLDLQAFLRALDRLFGPLPAAAA